MRKRRKQIHAADKDRIIAMEAEVAIHAAENDESGKPKGPPKFDVIAYTGGAMDIKGFESPVVVDLAGLAFGNSLIANLDHDPRQRVGHVTEKSKDNGQLKLGGIASAATAAAKEVVESAANGFVWQASIEARPDKLIEVAADKTVMVNGQEFTGPLYVARKSTLKGFAFVSHGADDNTTATIAAEAANIIGEKNMDKELRAFIEAMLPGVDVDSLSAEAIANLKADFDGKKGTRRTATVTKDIFAERKAERDRQMQIREIANKFLDLRPDDIEAIEKMHDHAIEAKMTVQEFRNEMYESALPMAAPVITSRTRERGLSNKILEAAICQSGNLSDIEDKFDDQTLQAAHDRFPQGIGLKQVICLAAEANGHRSNGGEVTPAVLKAACGPDRPIHGGQGYSTVTLTNLLANTANRFLFQGWMGVEQVWRSIASRSNPRDFKQFSNISLTGALQYEKVGPAGEIKHGTIGELAYTQQVETYALMLALTRKMIIDDDLSAFTAVPARLGRGAALKVNDVFWTVFLNNSSFFTAGNANVSTGAGSALGTADGAAINAAEVKFSALTDPDGKPLGVMPKIMLVPPTLANTGARWMGSQMINPSGTSGLGADNVYVGRYRVVSSAYMENSSYTGNSTAAWYLLADPNDIPVIDVAFLNGKDTPTVESAETDFNSLGMQWRGVIDFGVALQEFRGGVRSAGS